MKKKNKFQVFCVIGKSGSGKGTQVELLKKKFKDVFHIVLGDLLRAFIKQDNRIARTVGAKMNKGELAPDWLADYLWQKEFMKRAGKVRFVIFEGNPRTIKQAEELEDFCKTVFNSLPLAVYLNISDSEAKRRLLIRLICKKCKKPVPYKMLAQNPKKCPFCGGPLEKRKDDGAKAILKRLVWFRTEV
ncbi:TPA: hypothetical protein DEX28_00450, partial [Patescibacteria group bacterium]|nr:hypothetical protein [Patescibacteria group bacterium]